MKEARAIRVEVKHWYNKEIVKVFLNGTDFEEHKKYADEQVMAGAKWAKVIGNYEVGAKLEVLYKVGN